MDEFAAFLATQPLQGIIDAIDEQEEFEDYRGTYPALVAERERRFDLMGGRF